MYTTVKITKFSDAPKSMLKVVNDLIMVLDKTQNEQTYQHHLAAAFEKGKDPLQG